jgi:predicted transcriptional regulator
VTYEVIAGIKVRYKVRRSVQQVLIDILKNATEPIIPTHLMYRSNLSWKDLDKYGSVLKAKGLLRERVATEEVTVFGAPSKRTVEKGREYLITHDGLEVLKLYHQLQRLLGT